MDGTNGCVVEILWHCQELEGKQRKQTSPFSI